MVTDTTDVQSMHLMFCSVCIIKSANQFGGKNSIVFSVIVVGPPFFAFKSNLDTELVSCTSMFL